MADQASRPPDTDAAPITGSPLSGKPPIAYPVSIRQGRFEEKHILRGSFRDPAFPGECRSLFSVAPPEKVGQVAGNDRLSVLCLGPDEWLVVEAPGENAITSAATRGETRRLRLIQVSDYYCGIDLAGGSASGLLTGVVAVDLDPSAFIAGSCVQTALHHVPVTIWRQADADRFRIYVRWSLAEFVWDLLADLARAEDPRIG